MFTYIRIYVYDDYCNCIAMRGIERDARIIGAWMTLLMYVAAWHNMCTAKKIPR